MQGAYEIQSYCLGHTSFVTSSALAPRDGLLLTGGGDGTVNLWHYVTGKLLDSFQAAEPQSAGGAGASGTPGTDEEAAAASGSDGDSEGGDEAGVGPASGGGGGGDGGFEQPVNGCSIRQRVDCAPVLSVACSGSTVAAIVEGSQEVLLLEIQPPPEAAGAAAGHTLRLKQKLSTPGVVLPCQVMFDQAGRLFIAGGPVILTSKTVHLAVAAADRDGHYALCTESVLPDSSRVALEARDAEEEALMCDSGVLPAEQQSYSAHLKKKAFTVEELHQRKRVRKDLIENARLKAQRTAQDAVTKPL